MLYPPSWSLSPPGTGVEGFVPPPSPLFDPAPPRRVNFFVAPLPPPTPHRPVPTGVTVSLRAGATIETCRSHGRCTKRRPARQERRPRAPLPRRRAPPLPPPSESCAAHGGRSSPVAPSRTRSVATS